MLDSDIYTILAELDALVTLIVGMFLVYNAPIVTPKAPILSSAGGQLKIYANLLLLLYNSINNNTSVFEFC